MILNNIFDVNSIFRLQQVVVDERARAYYDWAGKGE